MLLLRSAVLTDDWFVDVDENGAVSLSPHLGCDGFLPQNSVRV